MSYRDRQEMKVKEMVDSGQLDARAVLEALIEVVPNGVLLPFLEMLEGGGVR